MKNLKKILSIVLCMAMVLSLASFTAYAEETEIEAHECEWRLIEIAPTCTTYGFDLYVCTVDGCFESYADNYVDAFGHEWIDATCVELAICERCGETEGDFAAHNIVFSSEGFDASCLEDGLMEFYYCGDCGVYFADAECTIEMEDQTGLNLVIPMTGHNVTVSSEGFAASCLEEGMIEFYYCGDCGTYFADAECTIEMEDQTGANLGIPQTGHNITASSEGFEASCLEDGIIEYYYCGECGIYFADAELTTLLEDQTGANLVIPMTGHKITSSCEGFDASCLEEGMIEYYYCGECNTYFADAELTTELEDQTGNGLLIPTAGHKITSSCEGFEASCLEEGMIEYYYCGECGTYFADAELTTELEDQSGMNLIIPAINHNYEAVVTAPTCTAMGFTTYTCANCGDAYVADEVAMLNHEYVIVKKIEASCAEGGYVWSACSKCGHERNYEIPATNNHVMENGVCVGCGMKQPGFDCDHADFVVLAQVEATCDMNGFALYKCNSCNTTWTNTFPAAHKYEIVVNAPTCTEAGFSTYTCTACGDSKVADEVAALGHAFCEPSCVELATCERCGATEGELAAHNITSSCEGFEASCLEEGMIEYYYCGECGTYFADAELTTELEDQTGANLVIPMTAHNIVISCEGFEASCMEEGMIEYYYCGDCGTYFADAELTTKLEDQTGANLIIPMAAHTIVMSSTGFEATCTEEGVIEYYYCGSCNTYFADAELTTKLEDQTGMNLMIPMTAHTYGEWVVVKEAQIGEAGLKQKTCSCGDVISEEIPALGNPADTGDTAIILFAIFALVAMAGMTVVVSKKKYF